MASVSTLEIDIEGTITTFYVRAGNEVYGDETVNSPLTKNTTNHSYSDTTHQYLFTTEESNQDGDKIGVGTRSLLVGTEIKSFTWRTNGGTFYPLVYIQPPDPQQVAADSAFRAATTVRGSQATPSANGITLIEEGDKLYGEGKYAESIEKYNQAKAEFEESKRIEDEPYWYTFGNIGGVLAGICLLCVVYYIYQRHYRKPIVQAPVSRLVQAARVNT